MNSTRNPVSISEQNIPKHLLFHLKRANLTTPVSIVKTSNAKFRKLGFSPKNVQLIRNAILPSVVPQALTAAECINTQKWKRVRCGCKALDDILSNGIPTFGITEISGESGSGKTQICLQLAVSVQLPESLGGLGKGKWNLSTGLDNVVLRDLNTGAAYISTESDFPASRLCQIADYFKSYYGERVSQQNFADNVFIESIYDADKLLECVNVRLPRLMQQQQIGIVIIDSIGAIFRVESNIINRAKNMRKLVDSLLKLSDEHNCVILCVNQVTSVFKDRQSGNQFIPCLGLAWANLVSTRLQIFRTNKTLHRKTNDQAKTMPYTVRKMEVIFAPDLKQNMAEFLITSNGVSDISDFC